MLDITKSSFMNKVFIKLNNLLRPFSIYKTADPIKEEIEEVARCEDHLFLMIKARWIFCAIGLFYALITLVIGIGSEERRQMLAIMPPLIIIGMIVVLSNAWYNYSYRWFSHIRGLRHFQFVIDSVLIIFIIHFTGGVVSWGWILYPLLVIESALIFERCEDTWFVAGVAIFLYGILLALEFRGIITQIPMPFYTYNSGYGIKLGWLYISWVAFIIVCTALVSTYLVYLHRANQVALKQKIIRDHLTGLYNRKHFFYSLNSEFARARRFEHIVSILFVDIDGFKEFNDTFGHMEGDKLLQSIAGILLKNIRSNQQLGYDVDVPFRYGGDEFAIILPETSPSSGMRRAEQLRKKIAIEGVLNVAERIRSQVQKIYTGSSRITTSIGVATFPIHGTNVEEIIQAADKALYVAKQRGKNAVMMAETDLI